MLRTLVMIIAVIGLAGSVEATEERYVAKLHKTCKYIDAKEKIRLVKNRMFCGIYQYDGGTMRYVHIYARDTNEVSIAFVDMSDLWKRKVKNFIVDRKPLVKRRNMKRPEYIKVAVPPSESASEVMVLARALGHKGQIVHIHQRIPVRWYFSQAIGRAIIAGAIFSGFGDYAERKYGFTGDWFKDDSMRKRVFDVIFNVALTKITSMGESDKNIAVQVATSLVVDEVMREMGLSFSARASMSLFLSQFVGQVHKEMHQYDNYNPWKRSRRKRR